MNFRRLSQPRLPFPLTFPTLGRSPQQGPQGWFRSPGQARGRTQTSAQCDICLSTAHISSPQLLQLGPRTGLPPRSGPGRSSRVLGNSVAPCLLPSGLERTEPSKSSWLLFLSFLTLLGTCKSPELIEPGRIMWTTPTRWTGPPGPGFLILAACLIQSAQQEAGSGV